MLCERVNNVITDDLYKLYVIKFPEVYHDSAGSTEMVLKICTYLYNVCKRNIILLGNEEAQDFLINQFSITSSRDMNYMPLDKDGAAPDGTIRIFFKGDDYLSLSTSLTFFMKHTVSGGGFYNTYHNTLYIDIEDEIGILAPGTGYWNIWGARIYPTPTPAQLEFGESSVGKFIAVSDEFGRKFYMCLVKYLSEENYETRILFNYMQGTSENNVYLVGNARADLIAIDQKYYYNLGQGCTEKIILLPFNIPNGDIIGVFKGYGGKGEMRSPFYLNENLPVYTENIYDINKYSIQNKSLLYYPIATNLFLLLRKE